MSNYTVFVGNKAVFVSSDKRKAKRMFSKTPVTVELIESAWGEKVIYQNVTLWKDSVTIDAK